MAAGMELHGERRSDGVKVKFIETQFVSSDAASFKSVVQRLTGKHSQMPPPPSVHRPRPSPRTSSGSIGAGEEGRPGNVAATPKQAPAAGFETAPARMEMEDQLHGLCDFADLFYTAPGARRGGGTINGFPY